MPIFQTVLQSWSRARNVIQFNWFILLLAWNKTFLVNASFKIQNVTRDTAWAVQTLTMVKASIFLYFDRALGLKEFDCTKQKRNDLAKSALRCQILSFISLGSIKPDTNLIRCKRALPNIHHPLQLSHQTFSYLFGCFRVETLCSQNVLDVIFQRRVKCWYRRNVKWSLFLCASSLEYHWVKSLHQMQTFNCNFKLKHSKQNRTYAAITTEASSYLSKLLLKG